MQVQRERAGERSRRVQWWWSTREKFLEREGVAEPSMFKGTTEGPYARLVTAVPGDPRRAVPAGCWGGGGDVCTGGGRGEEKRTWGPQSRDDARARGTGRGAELRLRVTSLSRGGDFPARQAGWRL